jgi:hypothetical protein
MAEVPRRFTDLKPSLDTTVEVITFRLSAPMDYTVTQRVIAVTDDGWNFTDETRRSSSSSDEDFDPKKSPD